MLQHYATRLADAVFGAPPSLVARGQLSPADFAAAGDALIAAHPAWRWRAASASDAPNADLPPLKQYLELAGLPLDAAAAAGARGSAAAAAADGLFDAGAERRDPAAASADSDGELDAAVFTACLCYDAFFRTPHLYVTGADASGSPLRADALLAAVSKDMAAPTGQLVARPTATLERHPHDAARVALSLHPCRHAQMMAALLDGVDPADHLGRFLTLFLRGVGGALRVEIDGGA